MNRFLHWINALGVLALAMLCVAQWRTNRDGNLEVVRLEKVRLELVDRVAARDQAIKGYVADLDDFRQRLTLAESQLKALDEKLSATIRERNQLAVDRDRLGTQRDQLTTSLHQWIDAVTARDASLKQAGGMIQQLASDRNDAVVKFNDLAGKYNALVKEAATRSAK